MTTPRELIAWNGANMRARQEYYTDPFAASRELAWNAITGMTGRGDIDHTTARAMRREVHRWTPEVCNAGHDLSDPYLVRNGPRKGEKQCRVCHKMRAVRRGRAA